MSVPEASCTSGAAAKGTARSCSGCEASSWHVGTPENILAPGGAQLSLASSQVCTDEE